MSRLLVTVGTDGFTDWVQLPDGSKLSLGPVSVLKFVSKLATGREAQQALDGFLAEREAMLRVDETQMWELLAPRRRRWAADSFIAPDQRITPTRRESTMGDIRQDLDRIEKHIAALKRAAAANVPEDKMVQGRAILVKMAADLPRPTPNSAYYGFAEPAPVAQQQPQPAGAPVADLAYDRVQSNNALAEQIVTQAEATVDRIDALVKEGKRFNAARAKADVHAVTHKVASILEDTDLAPEWVAGDLKKLAARSDELHGLFFPKTARGGLVVLDDDDLDALTPEQRRQWKGYTYKMTYEVWDEEALEIGETDNKGWQEEGSEAFDTLEEVCRHLSHDATWLSWSSSSPDGKRDWLISQSEEDFRTGERTQYNAWIEREDRQPLSRDEIKFINRELRVR